MKTWIVAYVTTAAVFAALDAVWLGYVAREFYRAQMGALLAPQPSMIAAVAFYALYVVGIVYFAVGPALATGSWATALVSGALLGLVAYGTWDLTNLAVVRDWPVALSLVDMAWGACLTAVAATAGFFVTRALGA
jgi:uncharacterized membrane protein